MLIALFSYMVLSFSVPQTEPTLTQAYLQGVWAEDWSKDNPNFMVVGDSIDYLEDATEMYPYIINGNQFSVIIANDTQTYRVKIFTAQQMAFLNNQGEPSVYLYKK